MKNYCLMGFGEFSFSLLQDKGLKDPSRRKEPPGKMESSGKTEPPG